MYLLCNPLESMDCSYNILSGTFSFNGYLFNMVFKKDWVRLVEASEWEVVSILCFLVVYKLVTCWVWYSWCCFKWDTLWFTSLPEDEEFNN